MTNCGRLAILTLTAELAPALSAEAHCPGNVASVPLHYVNRYQMIVKVSVNDSRPQDFLLDTGTQVTILAPSLAARSPFDRSRLGPRSEGSHSMRLHPSAIWTGSRPVLIPFRTRQYSSQVSLRSNRLIRTFLA